METEPSCWYSAALGNALLQQERGRQRAIRDSTAALSVESTEADFCRIFEAIGGDRVCECLFHSSVIIYATPRVIFELEKHCSLGEGQ